MLSSKDSALHDHQSPRTPIGPKPSDRGAKQAAAPPTEPAKLRSRLSTADLTEREREVLSWLAFGKSGPEVATILEISVCTVRIHIRSILSKFDASNITHAVTKAFQSTIPAAPAGTNRESPPPWPRSPGAPPERGGPGATGRCRLVVWEDPDALTVEGRRLAGLDFLRAVCDRRLPPPPIAQLIGFRLLSVEPGRIVVGANTHECHYNLLGSLQGGIAATLLDAAMGCAVHSTLPAGCSYTTLEVKVNYLRALYAQSGEIRAEGTVVHKGRRIVTAEGRLTDREGRLYASGTTTCLVFSTPSKNPDAGRAAPAGTQEAP